MYINKRISPPFRGAPIKPVPIPILLLYEDTNRDSNVFVFVNGSEYETQFIDERTLLINAEKLESLDVITVIQKSNSTILTSSEPFTYFNVNLKMYLL